MKKKIIIISLIVILIGLVLGVVFVINNNTHVYDNYNKLLNDNLDFISSLTYQYRREGTINVTANYRGAHGENNPHDFEYLFMVKDNKLFISDNDGFNYLEDFNYLELINAVNNINDSVKPTSIKDGVIELDTKVISDLCYRKIDSMYLEVSTKGFIKRVSETKLHIKYEDKDDVIVFNEDLTNGRGTLFNKEVKYNKTTQGVSLQIGNDFKMNIFKKNDHIEYNIVSGEYTYRLFFYENKIKANVSGDAAIFRGLEMTFDFDKQIPFELTKQVDPKTICITRYFNALGKVGSDY